MKKMLETPVGTWKDLKARDVMKSPVVTLNEDVLLREAAQTLSDEHIGGAPVVDHRGEAIGVVSLFDIVAHLAGLERPAGEPGGFCRQGRLRFGAAVEAPEAEEETPEEGAPDESTVGEIMAPGIIGVPADASLDEAVRLLRERQIHRVFVLDPKGRLLGVISTMDILRALGTGA